MGREFESLLRHHFSERVSGSCPETSRFRSASVHQPDAESIARALGGKPSGGGFTARCPAHDDKTPSLTLADGDSGVVVCCHAGCSQADVIEALRSRDLWPRKGDRERYEYLDVDGRKLVTIVRVNKPGGKDIYREPRGVKKPAGGYPLYRLADVTARAELPVLMVEAVARQGGAASVRIVATDDLPEGWWDLADPVPPGVDIEVEWAPWVGQVD